MRMVRKTQDGQGQFLHNLIMEILGLVLTQLPNPTTDLYPAAVLSDATLEFVLSVDSGFSKKNVLEQECVFSLFYGRDGRSEAPHIYYSEFFKYLFGIQKSSPKDVEIKINNLTSDFHYCLLISHEL